MAINWIPHPRPGTSVLPGQWLCTVATGHTLNVEILDLESGAWFRRGGERLSERERVVAIAYVPEPMSA